MSETSIIPSSAELLAQQQPAPEMKFFTTNPHELTEAQGKMTAWVKMKLSELAAQVMEFESERDIAKQNHWAVPPWTRQIGKAERRIEYYQKMLALLEAGYVMVPSMQMDLFAIRTNREWPRRVDRRWSKEASEDGEGVCELGGGKWVGAQANVLSRPIQTLDSAGKVVRTDTAYWADSFQDVAFPMDVAKPVIMERTAAAMAMKAFDEIGVVRPAGQRRGDPFIVGRIRDPRPNKPGAAFFIAWHINMADL